MVSRCVIGQIRKSCRNMGTQGKKMEGNKDHAARPSRIMQSMRCTVRDILQWLQCVHVLSEHIV